LEEMKRSGKQSTEQVNIIISHMGRVASSMEGTLKQSRDAMESSARQSKAALDASIEALHTDQRAWVSIHSYDAIFSSDKPTTITIRLTNTGKTPALKVRSAVNAQILTLRESPVFDKYFNAIPGSPQYVGSHIETVMPPGAVVFLNIPPEDITISV